MSQDQIINIENVACYQNTGQGYWSSQDVAETLRTTPASQYENLCCYDARGNGNGLVCPTMTGDHENRITDYTALLIMDMTRRNRVDVNPPQKAPTLQAAMGTDGGEE